MLLLGYEVGVEVKPFSGFSNKIRFFVMLLSLVIVINEIGYELHGTGIPFLLAVDYFKGFPIDRPLGQCLRA